MNPNYENKYGNYSTIAGAYVKSRREYPQEVLDWCSQVIPADKPFVIDLGCGTGISTRQLALNGFHVIGVDISKEMIDQAQKITDSRCEYLVSPIESLPYPDNHFDAATAFTAFHWFNNEQAIDEIHRVVKPKGAFRIIHRRQIDAFMHDYRAIVERVLNKKLPSIYEDFDPVKSLKNTKFKSIQHKDMTLTEDWSVNDYVDYFQSTSLWNYLPMDKRESTKSELNKHYAELFPSGMLKKNVRITTVAGYKGK